MDELTSRQIAVVRFIFSRAFPLLFIAIGALLLYFGVKGVLTSIESRDWPHTNATVTSSSIRRFSSSAARGRTQHQAEICYEFFVQQGRYYGYHQVESPDAGEPMRLVEQHPKGKLITVYYRPDNPAVSLLEPGFRLKTLIMPLGGLLFLVPGILMAMFLPGRMKISR